MGGGGSALIGATLPCWAPARPRPCPLPCLGCHCLPLPLRAAPSAPWPLPPWSLVPGRWVSPGQLWRRSILAGGGQPGQQQGRGEGQGMDGRVLEGAGGCPRQGRDWSSSVALQWFVLCLWYQGNWKESGGRQDPTDRWSMLNSPTARPGRRSAVPSTVCRPALPACLPACLPLGFPLSCTQPTFIKLPSQPSVLIHPRRRPQGRVRARTPSHPPLHLHNPLSTTSTCGEGSEDT